MKHFTFFCYIQKESGVSVAGCSTLWVLEKPVHNEQTAGYPRSQSRGIYRCLVSACAY